MFAGSDMELGALCLHGTEGLIGLLLCGARNERWPEKKKRQKIPF